MDEIIKKLHETRIRKIEEAKESQDSEFMMLKRRYKKMKTFEDKYKQSGNLRDLLDDLDHDGKSYEVYYDRTDNGCTVFYED